MGKWILLVGAGVGYILGSRAGRQRYEQIRGAAIRVRENPRVQKTAHQAVDLAKASASRAAATARTQVPRAGRKVAGLARSATRKVTSKGRPA